MKCFNNLCRFRTEDNRCEGAPVPPEECRLHETLMAKKAPVFEVPLQRGVISPSELKDAYWELMCIASTIKKRYMKNEDMTESDFKYLSETILKVNMILNEVGL